MIFGEKCAVHISDLMSKIQSEDYCSGRRFATPTFCNSTALWLVKPESVKNRVFQFLTFRIDFYAILNLENHVCMIFLLNVISTQLIPESAKNRVFRFLTFRIVFYAFANLENNVCVIFQLNLVCTQIIPESEKSDFFRFLTPKIVWVLY